MDWMFHMRTIRTSYMTATLPTFDFIIFYICTRNKNRKKVNLIWHFGFCCYFVCFLLAGIWVLQLRQQAHTLRYHCPKRMSMEWSVPRESIWRVTSQTPEVPGTQLGPRPRVSLDDSKTPAATLPHRPEGKPAKMKKSAILEIWRATRPVEATLAGSS